MFGEKATPQGHLNLARDNFCGKTSVQALSLMGWQSFFFSKSPSRVKFKHQHHCILDILVAI